MSDYVYGPDVTELNEIKRSPLIYFILTFAAVDTLTRPYKISLEIQKHM